MAPSQRVKEGEDCLCLKPHHGLQLFGSPKVVQGPKKPGGTSKIRKKGLHCCGFGYQHTYNGKLTEGRVTLCVWVLYFRPLFPEHGTDGWWIGRFSRGSNRTRTTTHTVPGTCMYTLYNILVQKNKRFIYTICYNLQRKAPTIGVLDFGHFTVSLAEFMIFIV